MKLFKKKELTDAELERGAKQLWRVGTIIDVLYALIVFRLFTLLPSPDVDKFDARTVVQVLKTSYLNYMAMIIGIVLVIIYWNQSNLQFGNITRTDSKHASLSLLQVFCLMIYIYFVRLDLEFEGVLLLLQLQSVFLALAGYLSVLTWHYAIKNELVSDKLSYVEIDNIYLKLIPEPVTATLTFPFAYLGAGIWSLSWLLLFPVSYFSRIIRERLKERSNISEV